MGDGISDGYEEYMEYREEIMAKDPRWRIMATLYRLSIAKVEDLCELRLRLESDFSY